MTERPRNPDREPPNEAALQPQGPDAVARGPGGSDDFLPVRQSEAGTPDSPLKKETGSEPTSEEPAKNNGREAPVPLFQQPGNHVLGVCGFLLLAVLLVFGQTIRHEFVNFDDDLFVYENPQVTDGLTVHGIVWALTEIGFQWRPLTWVSHMIDWQLYGPRAGGHHLTNVLLHAATAVLLFLVFSRMTGRVWPSALVAALFAVHPLRVESVAWVTERKDVLSGLFFVLTLRAYVDYVRQRFSAHATWP